MTVIKSRLVSNIYDTTITLISIHRTISYLKPPAAVIDQFVENHHMRVLMDIFIIIMSSGC